jgi:putative membrane protein
VSLARYLTAGVGAAATAGLLLASAASPALAQSDGEPVVTNRETVQAFLTTDGEVDTARVYDQIDAYGTGEVTLENPVSTQGLRNLDGFGRPEVQDGVAVQTLDVDGEARLRTVSDFDGELPVTITPRYRLDGEVVDAGDLVGASGTVEVSYTVENVTGEPTEVTFTDGTGAEVTRTVDVPIPMVGQLVTVLPGTFTEVRSDEATVSGDGRGGTRLSFTMTLFPPIGSTTAEFAWTAQTSDGSLPPATVSVAPVRPLESPSFRGGAESYRGGAETGAELTDGATQIDTNLLRLRDGAAELLDGLVLLRNGADELRAGLQGEAAPGADQLAAGADQAAAGADELATGLDDLDSGARRLAAGLGEASAGGARLSAGATELYSGLNQLNSRVPALVSGVSQLDSGADQLAAGMAALNGGLTSLYAAVDTLPEDVQEALAADPQYQALLQALDAVISGIGAPTDTGSTTVLGGLNQIDGGLGQVGAGLQQVEGGLRFPGGFDATDCAVALGGGTPEACGAMDAVQFIAAQLEQGATDLDQLKAVFDPLFTLNGCSVLSPPPGAVPAPPANQPLVECQLLATLYFALFSEAAESPGAQAQVRLAAQALVNVYQGVDGALIPGIGALELGVADLQTGVAQLRRVMSNGEPQTCDREDSDAPDACGISQALQLVRAGIPALVEALLFSIEDSLKAALGTPSPGCDPTATLRCASAALTQGAGALAEGTEELDAAAPALGDGVQRLADGGAQLADGAGDLLSGLRQLDTGGEELTAGTSRAADGGDALADGNAQIADGAGQLADGLDDAADGSGQLSDGLVQAADGTPQIVDGAERLSVEGTSLLIAAGNETALDFGERFATVEAATERARDSGMPYGAPEGATGTAAYSIEIAGADGEGARNLGRGLLALGIFGGVAGVTALARRGV